MPDFTEAEIADAIANPRAGDTWRKGSRFRVVLAAHDDDKKNGRKWVFFVEYGPRYDLAKSAEAWLSNFSRWTRNATLVRRGG